MGEEGGKKADRPCVFSGSSCSRVSLEHTERHTKKAPAIHTYIKYFISK